MPLDLWRAGGGDPSGITPPGVTAVAAANFRFPVAPAQFRMIAMFDGLTIALIIALVALVGVWIFVRKRGGA